MFLPSSKGKRGKLVLVFFTSPTCASAFEEREREKEREQVYWFNHLLWKEKREELKC